MKKLLPFLVAALVFVIPAGAAGKQNYSLSLDSVSGGEAHFSVTRSVTGEQNLRNDPLPWVTVECDGGQLDSAVIWGTWDSPVGHVDAAASGNCRAYVTLQPWLQKPVKGTVVEFSA